MTRQAWLAHNVTLNAEPWSERDKGGWQKKLHDALRATNGKKPWLDKAVATHRDDYGIKSI